MLLDKNSDNLYLVKKKEILQDFYFLVYGIMHRKKCIQVTF